MKTVSLDDAHLYHYQERQDGRRWTNERSCVGDLLHFSTKRGPRNLQSRPGERHERGLTRLVVSAAAPKCPCLGTHASLAAIRIFCGKNISEIFDHQACLRAFFVPKNWERWNQFYFSGDPCRRGGHSALHLFGSAHMCALALE